MTSLKPERDVPARIRLPPISRKEKNDSTSYFR